MVAQVMVPNDHPQASHPYKLVHVRVDKLSVDPVLPSVTDSSVWATVSDAGVSVEDDTSSNKEGV